LQAIGFVKAGQYDDAIRSFEKAIQLNPGDVGHDYVVHSAKELPSEAIAHGENQMHRMLNDRPNMGRYIERRDPLWSWTVRRFAGEGLGKLVYWDASLPTRGFDADNSLTTNASVGRIRIAANRARGPGKGEPKSFEELWANGVFELHNIANANGFEAVYDAARSGEIDKDEFVARMFNLELRAVQQTRAFYVRGFLPWVAENGLGSEPRVWFTSWWGDSRELLYQLRQRSDYPWDCYGPYFDELRKEGPTKEGKE
jgi:hypothetical protein